MRRVLLVSLVFVYFFSSTGFPIPSPRFLVSKDHSRPFPCMDNPCGCLTYEQCWAGDCCCSTIAEKLKWARENDIIPPESALRFAQTADEADEPECPHCVAKTKKKSCCSEESTSSESLCCEKSVLKSSSRAFQFVVGSFALKCKGHGFAGAGLLPISVEPPKPFVVIHEHTTNERIALIDRIPTSLANPPEAPPPRS